MKDIICKAQSDSAWKAQEKNIKEWLEGEKSSGASFAPYSKLNEFDREIANREDSPYCYSKEAHEAFNAHCKRVSKIVKKIGIDIK